VAEAIFNFCNDTMSAVYLAAVKDRLYCDGEDDPSRRRTQTVLHEIAGALIRLAAPILVHTAEEAWAVFRRAEDDPLITVHLEAFPEPLDWTCDPGWDAAMQLRRNALRELEQANETLGITNPLDAGVIAVVLEDKLPGLTPYLPELADLCGVSRFTLEAGPEAEIRIADLREEPRCERSWKRDGTVKQRRDGGWLTDRDAAVLGLD
jgi:isoleucyl-tRNA synthetase